MTGADGTSTSAEVKETEAKVDRLIELEQGLRLLDELRGHALAMVDLAEALAYSHHGYFMEKYYRRGIGSIWARGVPYEIEEAIQHVEGALAYERSEHSA